MRLIAMTALLTGSAVFLEDLCKPNSESREKEKVAENLLQVTKNVYLCSRFGDSSVSLEERGNQVKDLNSARYCNPHYEKSYTQSH